MEGPVAVIDPGADKVGEHVVAVGGADELPHRQAHPLGVVAGEDVAEVARGHAEVHLLPQLDLPGPQQVAVGGDIVDDLGQDAAPVDGVGRGEEPALLPQDLPQCLVGEEGLHAPLGVVEVAPHGADAHVVPGLGDHLQPLHLADPVLGVEDQDLGPGHVREALQGGLAGVAGGGCQDAGVPLLPQLVEALGDELGEHLQR